MLHTFNVTESHENKVGNYGRISLWTQQEKLHHGMGERMWYRLGSQKLIPAVSVADYSMVRMLSAQLLRGTDCMNTSRPHLRDLSFRSVRESRTWSAMIKEVTAQNDLCVFQKRLVLIFIWLQNIKIQKDHKSFILSMFTKKVIHTGNWASLCWYMETT